MKKILISMLAVAALVSCSKEESILVDQGEAIAFGNAFVDNATRADAATDPSYSTTTGKGVALESFNVYGAVNGVNIFNGNLVEKNSAAYGAAWTLTGAKQYWIAGADYKFVGVVDGSSITGVTAITPDAAGLPASISYTSDGATDLLCDVVTVGNAAAPYPLVAFNYTHLLSKVKFSVKNTTASDANNYRFVLTSAKLTNAYESGVYDVTAKAWKVEEMAGSKTFVLDLLTIYSAATQYHNTELLLLPGASVGVYVKAEIQATDNGTTWKKVSEVEKTFSNVVTLAQATAYNFVVELGVGTEIQFTAAEMPDWGNGNTTDTDGDTVNDAIVK